MLAVAVVLLVVTGCSSSSHPSGAGRSTTTHEATTTIPASQRPIGHVFVIELENEGYASTWGTQSPAHYLNDALVPRGKLLRQYYAVGHASLDNYIAEISGQPPNPQTRGDCLTYTEFTGDSGCVYPSSVHTIADQLAAAGKRWRAYEEDMRTPCRHPAIGSADTTVAARRGDMYATRHNPFVYFHSIIDGPACTTNVVDLHALDSDLASADRTPNFVFVTPNLCHDGHDAPCVDGEPGGLTSADAFLARWVPKILRSPAFRTDGMLVVTLDEADAADASSCCGAPPPGGGRVGTLVISAHTRPGVDDTPYNHYGLLCSLEDVFGLAHLGRAGAPGLHCFGRDVYDRS